MNILEKTRGWGITLILLALVAAAALGMFFTRDSAPAETQLASSANRHVPIVDESPLTTARELAKIASDTDQKRLAQQALKLADHEVDLAFADELRDATEHPAPPTPQTRQLYARAESAQQKLQADQNHLADLKKKAAAAAGAKQQALQQEADLTQAQVELDQDELQDAQEDLIRSGADKRNRVQRQFTRYQAAQQAAAAAPALANNTAGPDYLASTLIAQHAAWASLRGKAGMLRQAQDDALRVGNDLLQKHDQLDKEIEQAKSQKQTLAQQAADQLHTAQPGASSDTTAAAILSLHQLSDDQKDLSDLDKRIQDQQQLAETYASWAAVVASHRRAALHGMLQSLLWIVLVVLVTYQIGRLIDHYLRDLSGENMRFQTLRIVLRFAFEAAALLIIVFVFFGVPNQITTVLGLAGAGLTVALQDFIISFVGWFILMGRHGIRVGDWVEINGVAGEVIEIGLLRTLLLETGSATDAGYPTGRKVAMMNSFAIQGHFFNFSTSGQWLWDEVQVLVPASEDPYPVVDAIQKMVVKETEKDTQAAQQEWQQANSRYRVRAVSATPAVNLRPTPAGVEVHVRYIARANERYAMRTRLYQCVVELLHRRGVNAAAAQALPAGVGAK